MNFTLITGNKGKVQEWRRLLPADFVIDCVDIDLDEIQSTDSEKIVADKARRAYAIVQKPVVVEDVAVGLERLGGLPGPFIKFFIKVLGEDALYQLAQREGEAATSACSIAYYDGKDMRIVTGKVKGTVVAARGDNGFGFDKVFMPDGQALTYGEMTPAQKDLVSHRSKAIKLLAKKLKDQDL